MENVLKPNCKERRAGCVSEGSSTLQRRCDHLLCEMGREGGILATSRFVSAHCAT
jgi:hypothetical protein